MPKQKRLSILWLKMKNCCNKTLNNSKKRMKLKGMIDYWEKRLVPTLYFLALWGQLKIPLEINVWIL